MSAEDATRAGARLVPEDVKGRLWAQVRAIEATPTSRRDFLRYEAVCGRCSDRLLTGLATSPTMSLLVRGDPPPTRTYVVPASGLSRGESQRRGERMLIAIRAGEEDDGRDFIATCSCQQIVWPLWKVHDALRRGDRKTVVRPATL